MGWNFKQGSGLLWNDDGTVRSVGWAGQREGKNNPAMQDVPKTGPLPVGEYTINEPHDSPHTGPYTMDLTPSPNNNMFGRDDFRIHGAAFEHPELSSEGCIIMPKPVREKIWTSGDRKLTVVA
jgi:hypothetical protein